MSNLTRGGRGASNRARPSKRGGGPNKGTAALNAPTGPSNGASAGRSNGPTRTTRGFGGRGTARASARGSFTRGAVKPSPKQQQPKMSKKPPPSIERPSDETDYAARWSYLQAWNAWEREVSDWGKPSKLEDAVTPVGTCQDMCPEYERVLRIYRLKDVHISEKNEQGQADESRMVKRFARSAAGQEHPVESDLRPPHVLRKTVDYLFGTLAYDDDTLARHYGFIWDRTRAIRLDFSVQQVTKPEDVQDAAYCFEHIVRFHLLAHHLFAGLDRASQPADYNASQDREQLDKTLRSLFEYYTDHAAHVHFANEAEFRAYGIVFQSRQPTVSVETIMNSLPLHVAQHSYVRLAFDIYAVSASAANYEEGMGQSQGIIALSNWGGYFRTIFSPMVPYLVSCAAELYFPQIRSVALATIIRAFKQPKASASKLSLVDLKPALGADDITAVEDILSAIGLSVIQDKDGSRHLDLTSADGMPQSTDFQPPSRFVESKRKGRTITAVIGGLTCKAASESNEMDAEEQTMFVPEVHTPTANNVSTPSAFQIGTSFGEASVQGTPSQPSVSGAQPAAQPSSIFGSTAPSAGFGTSIFANAGKAPALNQGISFGTPATFGFSSGTDLPRETLDASSRKKSVSFGTDVQPAQPSQGFLFGTSKALEAGPFSSSSQPSGPSQEEKDRKAETARAEAARLEEEQRLEREAEVQKRLEEERRQKENEEKMRAQQVEAARQRAAQEAAARQAQEEAERRRLQQIEAEQAAQRLEDEKEAALNTATLQLLQGREGLIHMLLEHVGSDLFAQAQQQYSKEQILREADDFRSFVLMRRYGHRWRSRCMVSQVRKRRRDRKLRAQEARDEEERKQKSRPEVAQQLAAFRQSERDRREAFSASHNTNSSSDSQTSSNKENNPPGPPARYDASRSDFQRFRQSQRDVNDTTFAEPRRITHSATSNPPPDMNFGASLLTNGLTRESVEPGSSHLPSRLQQSSLGSNSSTSAFGHSQSQRYDTTIGPYFKMKALTSGSGYSAVTLTEHERKRSRSERYTEQDLERIQKRLRSSESPYGTPERPRAASPSKQARDRPRASTSSGIDLAPRESIAAEEDDEKDPLMASIRQANRLMSEGTYWFHDATRSLNNTPEVTPQRASATTARINGTRDSPASDLRQSKFLGRPSRAEREKRKREEEDREEHLLEQTRQRARQWANDAGRTVKRQNALAEAQKLPAEERELELLSKKEPLPRVPSQASMTVAPALSSESNLPSSLEPSGLETAKHGHNLSTPRFGTKTLMSTSNQSTFNKPGIGQSQPFSQFNGVTFGSHNADLKVNFSESALKASSPVSAKVLTSNQPKSLASLNNRTAHKQPPQSLRQERVSCNPFAALADDGDEDKDDSEEDLLDVEDDDDQKEPGEEELYDDEDEDMTDPEPEEDEYENGADSYDGEEATEVDEDLAMPSQCNSGNGFGKSGATVDDAIDLSD